MKCVLKWFPWHFYSSCDPFTKDWNTKYSVCSKEELCKKRKPASGVIHHLPFPLKSFTSAWTTLCLPLSYATHCKDLAACHLGWKGFQPFRSVWFCSCKQWGARKEIFSWQLISKTILLRRQNVRMCHHGCVLAKLENSLELQYRKFLSSINLLQ